MYVKKRALLSQHLFMYVDYKMHFQNSRKIYHNLALLTLKESRITVAAQTGIVTMRINSFFFFTFSLYFSVITFMFNLCIEILFNY